LSHCPWRCSRTMQCGSKEHGLVENIGGRWMIGLDDLGDHFQPQ